MVTFQDSWEGANPQSIPPDSRVGKALTKLGFGNATLKFMSYSCESMSQLSYGKRNLPPPTDDRLEKEALKKYRQFEEPSPPLEMGMLPPFEFGKRFSPDFEPKPSFSTGACIEKDLSSGGTLALLAETFQWYIRCPPSSGPLCDEIRLAVHQYKSLEEPILVDPRSIELVCEREPIVNNLMILICRRECDKWLSHSVNCDCPEHGPFTVEQLESHPPCLLMNIPEDGDRIRSATMMSGYLSFLLTIVQSIGLRAMQNVPEFRLPMKGISRQELDRMSAKYVTGQTIMSADQIGATDNFHIDQSFAIMYGLSWRITSKPQWKWLLPVIRAGFGRFTCLKSRAVRTTMFGKLMFDKFQKFRKEKVDSIAILVDSVIGDLNPEAAYLAVAREFGIEFHDLLWSTRIHAPGFSRAKYTMRQKKRSFQYFDPHPDRPFQTGQEFLVSKLSEIIRKDYPSRYSDRIWKDIENRKYGLIQEDDYISNRGILMGSPASFPILNFTNLYNCDGLALQKDFYGDDAILIGDDTEIDVYRERIISQGGKFNLSKEARNPTRGVFAEILFRASHGELFVVPGVKMRTVLPLTGESWTSSPTALEDQLSTSPYPEFVKENFRRELYDRFHHFYGQCLDSGVPLHLPVEMGGINLKIFRMLPPKARDSELRILQSFFEGEYLSTVSRLSRLFSMAEPIPERAALSPISWELVLTSLKSGLVKPGRDFSVFTYQRALCTALAASSIEQFEHFRSTPRKVSVIDLKTETQRILSRYEPAPEYLLGRRISDEFNLSSSNEYVRRLMSVRTLIPKLHRRRIDAGVLEYPENFGSK